MRFRTYRATALTPCDETHRDLFGGRGVGKGRRMALKVDEAAETLRAMAEIPCLRGGIAVFDYELEAQGWYSREDWSDAPTLAIWVPVPESGDLADCRIAIEAAIDDARRVLRELIDAPSRNFRPEVAALVEQCKEEMRARLEALSLEPVW
jgi:hypothetical protein